MPNSNITEPQLAKRQRNLVFFSVAVLMFGWAPTEMQASINMFGLQIRKVDPGYMWSWGTAISCYLYFAWIITARDEDNWLRWRGGKLNELWNLRDFFWLGWITWKSNKPHGYSPQLFGSDSDCSLVLKIKIYNKKITDSDEFHKLSASSTDSRYGDRLIDKEYVEKNISRLWPFRRGYKIELHSGQYQGKDFYLMKADVNSQNKPSHVTLRKELLLSVFPPLLLGAFSIYTCLVKNEFL